MVRIPPAEIDGNVYERTMGHRPDVLRQWFALDEQLRFAGTLDPALKEEVRRVLAGGIGCTYCASLGRPDAEHRDTRTSLAVAFAEVLWENSRSLAEVDDAVFAVLAEEFSDAEIVELSCWVLFLFAAQGFGALMHLPAATDGELHAYAAWRRDGIAAAR
jgi:alkylhydroperoxidase family enzyme